MKAGFATVDITPDRPVWLVGYGGRDHRSEGVYQELEAGAIALRDGTRTAIVITADVIGFGLGFCAEAKARIADATGLVPGAIVLTATHTHCAPFYYEFAMPGEVEKEWADFFMQKLVQASCMAMADLQPASLEFSRGNSRFGVSRRTPDGQGGILFQPNPDGPMDRDLDTLWFKGQDGQVRGTLTVYGCHATGRGEYLIGGDYPGFFRRKLQEKTSAPAYFTAGCGGNIRPNFLDGERFRAGELEEIERVGEQLACEVMESQEHLEATPTTELELLTDFHLLPYLELPSREMLESTAADGSALEQVWANHLLAQLESGHLPSASPQEIQILRFSDSFQIIFLGGEVLTEIGMHLKEAFQPMTTVAAGYSNGLITYVPGKETYDLGGYEVEGAYKYFLRPAPFVKDVEDRIVDKAIAMGGPGSG